MATIPSFETILLEIHKSLGLEAPDKKQELIRLERPLEKYLEVIPDLIEEIFNALGMNEDAKDDALVKIQEFANFNNSIERSTWTYDADLRQVFWYLAGYSYAPWLGRSVAFWSIATPFDKGIPDGNFWYLPEIRQIDGCNKLVLPIAQVLKWLMDSLDQSMDDIIVDLGGGLNDKGKAEVAKVPPESIERTLYNWISGDIPHVENIERYFAEGTKFKGGLYIDEKTPIEIQYETLCQFIKHKKFDAARLKSLFPSDQTYIEKYFDQKMTDSEKKIFIKLMTDRYTPPALSSIRQKLLIARTTQDGYIRIGKLLAGSGFDHLSTDITINKALQLVKIFKASFTLTINAHKHCNGLVAENAYFENNIPPWDRLGIFLSVLPSRYKTGCTELANKFSRIFAELSPIDELEDHFGFDEASSLAIVKRADLQCKEDDDLLNITQQLRTHSPWRTLQSITNFALLNHVALNFTLNFKSRQMAMIRMQALAKTSSEILTVTTLELSQLLDENDRQHRPKEAKTYVEKLLEKAKLNSQSEFWNAIILYYEAKHFLAANDFETSFRLFNKVLDLCKKYGLGKLYGESARNTFALVVERHQVGFSIGNYEKYYRIMLAYGGLPKFEGDTPPLLEDVACFVSEFFWKNLYYPYHGEKLEKPVVLLVSDKLIAETKPLISNADWTNLNSWFKKNPKLKNSRLKEVRGNTVLMHWLKMHYKFEELPSNFNAHLSGDLSNKFETMTSYFEKLPTAICHLIEEWPKQVLITDFKLQTPLMLAANQGDLTFVKAFLSSQTNANQQDFKGRTALHAAVFGRSLDCVQEVLAHSPNLTQIMSNDTLSVLHVAVFVGSPEIVKILIRHTPELKEHKNGNGLNAFDSAKVLISEITQPSDFQNFKTYMKSENRKIGTLKDFQEVVAILSE